MSRAPSVLTLVNWDWRPAVLTPGWPHEAFAVLTPEGPWVKVDELDVAETAGVLTEDAWRATFEGKFGKLDLSTLPLKIAPYVAALAEHHRVVHVHMAADEFSHIASRLASSLVRDNPTPRDETEQIILALYRDAIISGNEANELLIRHLRQRAISRSGD
ncbi:hypothetical protein [Microvirga sp. 2TAF3]|uniref:hypothetical protein n=1 Tax=Microvirga sp. 2TAF3 TaxID=3233014 RepID=UPI003F945CAE